MGTPFKDLLTEKIRQIWQIEIQENPDWDMVEKHVNSAFKLILESNVSDEIDEYIIKYLDDFDIRKKDRGYGNYQRRKIRSILGF